MLISTGWISANIVVIRLYMIPGTQLGTTGVVRRWFIHVLSAKLFSSARTSLVHALSLCDKTRKGLLTSIVMLK